MAAPTPAIVVGNRRVTIQEVCDVACKGVQVQLEPNALAALADADKGTAMTMTMTMTITMTMTTTMTIHDRYAVAITLPISPPELL